MSGKTTIKPLALKAGSYQNMFLDVDGKHFIDAERETTYAEMVAKGVARHSEFMQPYLSDDYPSMDYLWPDMNLFGDVPGVNDALIEKTGGGGAASAFRFQCVISCTATISGSMCATKNPLKCYYGAITGDGYVGGWFLDEIPEGFGGINFIAGSGATPVYGIPSKNWNLMGNENAYWFTVGYNDIGTASGGWYYHPVLDRWIYIEAGRSTCYYDVRVNCPQCPPAVSISLDTDLTPDTIDPDDTVSVFVQDGLAPYTWELLSTYPNSCIVVGTTGYSLGSAETSTVENTVQCVAGNCGTEFGPVVGIQVTDACGETVTFSLRNTDGTAWTFKETGLGPGCAGSNCTPTGDVCNIFGGVPWDDIDGGQKWTFTGHNCRVPACTHVWVCGGGCDCEPPCGDPGSCHSVSGGPCFGGECSCYIQRYDYYYWTC